MHGKMLGFYKLFKLLLHQTFELDEIERATEHHPQVVGEKLNQMVVVQNRRILFKDLAVFGFLDIGFERHQAVFPDLIEQFEHQRKHIKQEHLVDFRTLENRTEVMHHQLDGTAVVRGNRSANRQTKNRQHFSGLPKHHRVSTVKHVARQSASKTDNNSEWDNHDASLLLTATTLVNRLPSLCCSLSTKPLKQIHRPDGCRNRLGSLKKRSRLLNLHS